MIKQAAKEALKSNHSSYKMGAVVVKGSRILSVASNKINRGCQYITYKKWGNSLHAEAHAILKLLKKGKLSDLSGSVIYVTRINEKNKLMNSKPCEFCISLASSVNIKAIYYTNSEGLTQCLQVK